MRAGDSIVAGRSRRFAGPHALHDGAGVLAIVVVATNFRSVKFSSVFFNGTSHRVPFR
jgi:hypothetical protein